MAGKTEDNTNKKTGKAASPKKKPAARKSTASSGKASAAAKAKKPASKRTTRKKKKVDSGTGKYVLIIMTLLTVIAVLINVIYSRRDNPSSAASTRNIQSGSTTIAQSSMRTGESPSKTISEKSPKPKKKNPETKKVEPVRRVVRIYFLRLDNRTERVSLRSVARRVGQDNSLNSALQELIKGPTPRERRNGLLTAVPRALRVRSVRASNGTAYIDFNGAIEHNATGSILLSRLDQIVYTATQFDGVSRVSLRVNGRRRTVLGHDGLSINGPLQRRR